MLKLNQSNAENPVKRSRLQILEKFHRRLEAGVEIAAGIESCRAQSAD